MPYPATRDGLVAAGLDEWITRAPEPDEEPQRCLDCGEEIDPDAEDADDLDGYCSWSCRAYAAEERAARLQRALSDLCREAVETAAALERAAQRERPECDDQVVAYVQLAGWMRGTAQYGAERLRQAVKKAHEVAAS